MSVPRFHFRMELLNEKEMEIKASGKKTNMASEGIRFVRVANVAQWMKFPMYLLKRLSSVFEQFNLNFAEKISNEQR